MKSRAAATTTKPTKKTMISMDTLLVMNFSGLHNLKAGTGQGAENRKYGQAGQFSIEPLKAIRPWSRTRRF